MAKNTEVPLQAGAYAFGERAIIRVMGEGAKVYLWVGLKNENGSCLGVLEGKALRVLMEEVAARQKKKERSSPPEMGRTAEPKRHIRFDGRRRG